LTKPLIWNCLESIGDDKLKRTLLFYPKGRLSKRGLFLRPLLIRLAYEAAGGNNWKDIVPIYAAYELLNISTYQANLSFDKKRGVTTASEINNQFISSMITRELAQKLVYEKLHDSLYLGRILGSINKINLHIYKGQFYDLNVLHKDNWEGFKTMHEYMEVYNKKCLYLSGIFFQECAYIGAILGENRNNVAAPLCNFGRYFGIGLHIVNDISNFIPTYNFIGEDKDVYADLKNNRLTLPVYYLLRYGKEYDKAKFMRLSSSKPLTNDHCFDMAQILINSEAIFYSKKIAKIFMKKAKQCLTDLENHEISAYLSTMSSVLKSNKYFNLLNRMHSVRNEMFPVESTRIIESILHDYTTN
jgi:geranylgeranyl pyrophosphate synthase